MAAAGHQSPEPGVGEGEPHVVHDTVAARGGRDCGSEQQQGTHHGRGGHAACRRTSAHSCDVCVGHTPSGSSKSSRFSGTPALNVLAAGSSSSYRFFSK